MNTCITRLCKKRREEFLPKKMYKIDKYIGRYINIQINTQKVNKYEPN